MNYTGIESIDKMIDKKINAIQTRKYFTPRKIEDCNLLIPEVEKLTKEYKNALIPWNFDNSWHGAEENIIYEAIEVIPENRAEKWKIIYDTAFNSAYRAAYAAMSNNLPQKFSLPGIKGIILKIKEKIVGLAKAQIWDYAHFPAFTAARYIASDVVLELLGDFEMYQNRPFEKVVKIFDLGLYYQGFYYNGKEESIHIDFPLKSRNLGCLIEGEKKIDFEHSWHESVSNRKMLTL